MAGGGGRAPGSGGATGGSGNGGKPGNTGGASATGGAGGTTTGGTFTVTSTWTNMAGCAANMSASCATLPTDITRSGAGTSPELHWTGAPANTKSFAVVLQDLSGNSTHWVIWNIPGTATMLPENVVERLARQSDVVAVPAGSAVFREGDIGDRFYIVESGDVEVSTAGRVLARRGPGESFGEIALLRDVTRTATVTALSDVVMRAIERRHFLPAVAGHAGASEQAELVVGRYMDTS